LWISKSDKLIEDAERDWTAIGGHRSDLVPLRVSVRTPRSRST
jgi:protein strawberry notch